MSRRDWALFTVVLAVGIALRLYALGARSFWFDEGVQILLSKWVAPAFHLMDPDYSNDPPLYPILVHFWYGLVRLVAGVEPGAQTSDALLRLMPCVFGVIGVALTFFVARATVGDTAPALFGAFLFAISPFQIYYAQDLRAYTLHVVLCLAAVLFLLKSLEENRPWHWIGLTVCLVLAIYNQFFAVWIIAALNLYFLTTIKTHRRLLGRWILCNIAIIVLAIPGLKLAFFIGGVFERAQEQWYPSPTLRIALITFKDFFAGYTPNHHLYKVVFVLCLMLLTLGLFALRKKPKAFLLLCILAFMPIIANVIYWRMKQFPYYTHRLMIVSAVPCYILVAQGIWALGRRICIVATCAVLTGLMAPTIADHYQQHMHRSWDHVIGALYKVQNREAAHYMANRLARGDFVGHRTQHTLIPFRHYLRADQNTLCFTGKDRLDLTRGYPHLPIYEHWQNVPFRLDSVAPKAKRLWLVQSYWQPFAVDVYSRKMIAWLDSQCLREEQKPFDGLTVHLYNTDPALRAKTKTNRVVDTGDGTVLHYLFPHDGRPTESVKGDLSACRDTSSDPQTIYEVRFDLAVADESGAVIQGNQFSTRFMDANGDGTLDALRLDGDKVQENDAIRIGGVDYSVLDLDGAAPKAVLASFPLYASGGFNYRFVLKNASPQARTIECKIYESAEVIEPLSFNSSNTEVDVWLPSAQYNPGPPPSAFNTFAIVAFMNEQTPGGEAIYRDVRLPAGEYAVFARIFSEMQPTNASCANARFTASLPDGAVQPIGTLEPNDPAGSRGWGWRRVGEVNSSGEPFRLTVAAYNDDQLPVAYFNLDRMLFVRAECSFETERFEVKLEPFEEKQFTFSADMGEYVQKRIDIETFDPAINQFRSIWFYVRQKN